MCKQIVKLSAKSHAFICVRIPSSEIVSFSYMDRLYPEFRLGKGMV